MTRNNFFKNLGALAAVALLSPLELLKGGTDYWKKSDTKKNADGSVTITMRPENYECYNEEEFKNIMAIPFGKEKTIRLHEYILRSKPSGHFWNWDEIQKMSDQQTAEFFKTLSNTTA